jgi:prophage regulatory protein
MQSSLNKELKELIKEAVREVIHEEIEKGTLAKPRSTSKNVIATKFKTDEIKQRDPNSIIRPAELSDLLSISTTTLYRWVMNGELPDKIKLGGRAVGWRYEDIQNWLNSNYERT